MDAPITPIVLQYAADAPPRPLDLLLLLLGAPGLAAVFAPFTHGVSPASALLDSYRELSSRSWDPAMAITLVCLPFLLPFAAWGLRLRWILWGPATRVECRLALVAALLGAAALTTLVGVAAAEPGGLRPLERFTYGAAAALLLAGAGLLALLWRRGEARDLRVRVALMVPYVANSVITLVAFVDDREIGWYLTLVSGIAALAELVLLAVRRQAAGVA